MKNSGVYNQNIKNNVFLRTSVLLSVFESINFNNKNTFNDDPLYNCTLEINYNFVTQHSRFCSFFRVAKTQFILKSFFSLSLSAAVQNDTMTLHVHVYAAVSYQFYNQSPHYLHHVWYDFKHMAVEGGVVFEG